jgi:hypothetical protein
MTRSAPDDHRERFGLLLFLLAFTYVLSAFVSGVLVSASQVLLFMGVLLLALRTGQLPGLPASLVRVAVIAGSVAAVTASLVLDTSTARAAADLWTALVLLFAVTMIVTRILAHQVITMQSILGAISAYMIIGLMFASIYRAIDLLGSGFFVAADATASQADQSVSVYQYFSFTTLTTLGYGDFTAAGNEGRAIAVLEALGGQVFLATLVARLVAAFRPTETRQDRGRPRSVTRHDSTGRPGGGHAARRRPRPHG